MGMVIINFKAYQEGFNQKALEIAKAAEEISKKTEDYIAIAPSIVDLAEIAKKTTVHVYAQHIDPVSFGSHTGCITAEMIKEKGAKGSLINHSEKRLKLSEIEFLVSKLRGLGLISVVCTNNIGTTAAASALNPDFVAVEPPELIGTGIPVSKAEPEIVRNSVKIAKKINKNVKVLCGAGITTHEDYRAALELGADGVLIASGIVKAKNPKKALEELIGV